MNKISLFAFVLSVMAPTSTLGQTLSDSCGSLANAFGPFDYRTVSKEEREKVELYHFTTDVEQLRRGATGSIGADIGYTLRAFPNHPRALLAMAKLSIKQNKERPTGSTYSINCWFERAVRFQPSDPNVRLVLGIYLTRKGQSAAAIEQLRVASEGAPDSGNFHYNLGLAYLDAGDAESALRHAWRADELQYTLQGLKSRLQKIGKWRDPN